MLYFCDKCQDYTEHKIKSIILKSGDDVFVVNVILHRCL